MSDYCTEAEAMNDLGDMFENEDIFDPPHGCFNNDSKIEQMKEIYAVSKGRKTGEYITCPYCNAVFKKKSYQQAFCKTKHKDKYWNIVDEDRSLRAKLFNR